MASIYEMACQRIAGDDQGADKESHAFGVRTPRQGQGTEETEGEARTDARKKSRELDEGRKKAVDAIPDI